MDFFGLLLKARMSLHDTKLKCFPVFSDCHGLIYNCKDNQYRLPAAVFLKEDIPCQSIWIYYTAIRNYTACQ